MASDVGQGREHYGRLVTEFGRGWEKGLPGVMSEVFTPEGVFFPSPFDEPVRGRQAIAQYWREVPSDQAEISFRFGEVFVAGPWFATEFRCTYRRLKTGDWIEVSGAMFCEAAAEKISEMRMYWERVVRRR